MRDEPLKVAGTMTVSALLAQWPELARVFHERGMSCPGCAMSRFDALDYVARVHGLAKGAWLRQLAGAARRRGAKPRAEAPGSSRRRVNHDTDGDPFRRAPRN